jgi:Rod binding domain-containing protein
MPDPIALPGAPLPMSTTAQVQRREPEGTPEMRRTAEQFESMFLSEMLGPMFEGLDTDGLGGGGVGEEVFRPMLIEKYAEAISHNGGVGISQSILRELVRLQQSGGAAPAALTEPAAPALPRMPALPEAANGADR